MTTQYDLRNIEVLLWSQTLFAATIIVSLSREKTETINCVRNRDE